MANATRAWTFGDLAVAKQIVKAAKEMEINPSDLDGVSRLRYGKPMRDLDDRELCDFRDHTQQARARYVGVAEWCRVEPLVFDERNSFEQEWDAFVLAGDL